MTQAGTNGGRCDGSTKTLGPLQLLGEGLGGRSCATETAQAA